MDRNREESGWYVHFSGEGVIEPFDAYGFASQEEAETWIAGFSFHKDEDGHWYYSGRRGPRAAVCQGRPRTKGHHFERIRVWPPNLPGSPRKDNFTGF